MNNTEARIKDAAVKQAAEILKNAGFDAVVLMCTWVTEDGMSAIRTENSGNWYAQCGMMKHFLSVRHHQAAEDIPVGADDEEDE